MGGYFEGKLTVSADNNTQVCRLHPMHISPFKPPNIKNYFQEG